MDAYRDPSDAVHIDPWNAAEYTSPIELAEDALECSVGEEDEEEAGTDGQSATDDVPKREQVTVVPNLFEGGSKAAIASTLDSMAEGRMWITPALLRSNDYWASPRGLERVAGASRFGNWSYRADTRWNPRDSKLRRVLPAVFIQRVLDDVQGTRSATLDSPDGAVVLDDFQPHLDRAILQLRRVLDERLDSGPMLKAACSQCCWRKACTGDAMSSRHLSLISGMRRDSVLALQRAGVATVDHLAQISSAELLEYTGFKNRARARRAVLQARSYVSGQPLLVLPAQLPPPNRVEAFIDFESLGLEESDPIILFGVLVRRGNNRRFTAILVRDLKRSRTAWRKFCQVLGALPHDAPLYHFGSYERRVMERYRIKFGTGARFLPRLTDMYAGDEVYCRRPFSQSRAEGTRRRARLSLEGSGKRTRGSSTTMVEALAREPRFPRKERAAHLQPRRRVCTRTRRRLGAQSGTEN